MIILILTVAAFAGVPVRAAEAPRDALTAANVFRNIPLEVLEILRPSTRLDMLDYYEQADSLWQAPNAMEGYSQLEIVTPDYLKLIISPVSTLEIKILTSGKAWGKRQFAMTIYTVGGDDVSKDSSVEFFDEYLMPVRQNVFLKMPELKDYFNLKGSDVTLKELRDYLPFQTVEFSTGPGDTPLTATFTTLDKAPEETRQKLMPLLKNPLTLVWKGKYELKNN